MKIIKSLQTTICAFALCAATSASAQNDPTPDQIFSYGRKAAYAHSMDLLGISRSHSAPAGTTMSLFYTQAPEYRNAYISGAIFGFAHIASILGERTIFECYRDLAPHSAKALDAVWASGNIPGNSGMVATLRSFCVSSHTMQAIGRR